MAYKTAVLTLYNAPDLQPDMNCKIDSIGDYLATLTSKVYSIQLPNFDLTFELNLTCEYPTSINFTYNYFKIIIESKTYYGFITDHKLASNGSVRIQCSVDTINSFWSNVTWSSRTSITRQHKDRFVQKVINHNYPFNLYRKVDEIDEGIQPMLYKKTSQKIQESSSALRKDWYLIYKTENNLSDSNLSNPLHCYLCADEATQISSTTTALVSKNDLTETYVYLFLDTNLDNVGGYFSAYSSYKIGQYNSILQAWVRGLMIVKEDGQIDAYVISTLAKTDEAQTTVTQLVTALNSIAFKGVDAGSQVAKDVTDINAESYGLICYYDINGTPFSVGSSVTRTVYGIGSIDKTDSKIMKIIALPYMPDDITYSNPNYDYGEQWSYVGGLMQLNDLTTEFIHTIGSYTDDAMQRSFASNYSISDLLDSNFNDENESKLFNSNFRSIKFVYDNFAKEVRAEYYSKTITSVPSTSITFKPSNSIQSKFIFDIYTSGYTEIEDFGEYLNVTRNNEISLYNNDYLNYMRLGYNYDKKNRQNELASKSISTGLQVVGAIASFASSYATGGAGVVAGVSLATSAIASATSLVTSIVSSEQTLQEKIATLQAQSGSISQADDFNLLKYYSDNRMWKFTYSVSDEMKNALATFFHLTGYACHANGVPVWDSRCWFNFVQCSPVFESVTYDSLIGYKFLDDFKSRFQAGVTIYHKCNNTWNLKQTKENWETWIIQ